MPTIRLAQARSLREKSPVRLVHEAAVARRLHDVPLKEVGAGDLGTRGGSRDDPNWCLLPPLAGLMDDEPAVAA